MAKRVSLSLDEDAYQVLETEGSDNKSAFVSAILKEYKRQKLERGILSGMAEDDGNTDYLGEFHDWDVTLLDGVEDSGEQSEAV